jgi:murein DD-endopeptidase MepM/ murein hydrolase activator NlpD
VQSEKKGFRLANGKFTILVIPEDAQQVRRVVLRRGTLRLAVVALFLLFGALGFMSWDLTRNRADIGELEWLRQAHVSQDVAMRELSRELESLQRQMVVLAQNDAKVRVLAEFTPAALEPDTGVGGPAEISPMEEASDLQREIDRIREAISLRRDSQEQIRGFLNDQSSLLAATPFGRPTFSGVRKMHEGIDIACRTGTPVIATADGIVSRAQSVEGYGKLVVVDHGYGYQTFYAHNSRIHVKVGDRVRRGQKIAAVGSTGSSTGPHVHYEVRLNQIPVNPYKFL